MNGFERVKFAGTFRTYQQSVLDRASSHLRDGHIHIVAAPGSGKTILGLELVRRLGKPALILAPSVTIRRQWGERFAESFLPADSAEADYVSEDLRTPRLLTCVTYQALHAAMQKIALKADSDPEGAETEAAQDFTDFDLLGTLRRHGITTVCLDEAHHLRREWQKALEQFLQAFSGQAQIIALTATPPYDSTPAEWDSYMRVCGEVDEEIFVPQLVAQKTLCPHQDYLYFNPPTESEAEVLRAHRQHAQTAARQIAESGLLPRIRQEAEEADLAQQDANASRAVDETQRNTSVPALQEALSAVLAHKDVFSPDVVDALCAILAENAVLEKGKVCLTASDKTDKMLLSSAGKLESIQAIMASESASLGEDLRALILTDYIRKELINQIGSDEPLSVMGAVPIFEAVRRTIGARVPIALLSGTLVILPNSALDAAATAAAQRGVEFSASPLPRAPYSEARFAGSNKNKVSVVTELLQRGVVRTLIGTASLLGEGWDAPCINALILASCVGSFMLTNQMRGRAIRIDKTKPDKASNIWHLVTVDPDDTDNIPGADYVTMQRRFDGFLAPDSETPWIESGTDRLHLPQPPYTANQMQAINTDMLTHSRDRAAMAALWQQALAGDPAPQVLDVCEIPNTAYSKLPAQRKRLRCVLWLLVSAVLLCLPSVFTRVIGVCTLIPALVYGLQARKFRRPETLFRETGSILLRLLREKKLIASTRADVFTLSVPERNAVYLAVQNAGLHDKQLFSRAAGERFSAIGDTRYIFVPDSARYVNAFAIPSALDRKKEDAQQFTDAMRPLYGKGTCLYTRGNREQKAARQCRETAELNRCGCSARYKKIVHCNVKS